MPMQQKRRKMYLTRINPFPMQTSSPRRLDDRMGGLALHPLLTRGVAFAVMCSRTSQSVLLGKGRYAPTSSAQACLLSTPSASSAVLASSDARKSIAKGRYMSSVNRFPNSFSWRFYLIPTVLFVCSATLICLGHPVWGGVFLAAGVLTCPRYAN